MASKTAPDLSTLSPTPGNDLWNNVVIRSSICDLLDTSTLTRLARLDRSTFASSVRYFWSGETESFGTDERLDKVKDAGRRRIYADAVRSIRASHFGDVDQSLLERWILQYPNVVNIHISTAKSHFRLRAQRDRSHRIVSFHCIQGVLNDSRASAMLYSNLAGIRQVVPAVYGATGILNGLVIIDKGDEDALDQIIAKYDIVLGRVVISSMLLVSDAAARTSLEKFLARTGVVDVTIRIEEERNEWGPVLNSGNHAHARLALDSARLIITRQRIASIQGLRCPLHEAMNLILEYSDIFRALESLGISAHTYMGLQRILDVKMPDFEDRALGSTSTSPMLVDLTIRCDTEIGFPGEGAQLYYPRHAAVIEQIARMLLHAGGSAVRFCIQGSADTTGSARDEGAVWQCQSGVMPLQKWVGIRVRSLIAVAQWKARDAMRDQVDEEAIGLD